MYMNKQFKRISVMEEVYEGTKKELLNKQNNQGAIQRNSINSIILQKY